MKKAILSASLLLASISQADIIKCTFTEPFVNSEYSTSQSTLTYTGQEMKTVVIKNVSLQIKGAGSFELVGKDKKVLQALELTYKGSNGMSNTIYPYEVKDTGLLSAQGANGGYGGCVSNYLKSKEGED